MALRVPSEGFIFTEEEFFPILLEHYEALLIDWCYTLHSWDEGLFHFLCNRLPLREKLIPAILSVKDENLFPPVIVKFTRSEIEELLVFIPTFYQIGAIDAGLSLKIKLYKVLGGQDASKDGSKNKTEDSSFSSN